MKRITTNDENHILASLNLFFVKDNEVWIRGGGPEPDYADCTLVDWIVSAAEKHHLDIFSRDAEGLGEEMYDAMQFDSDTIEGIVALLHAAAIQAAEMRAHLAAIEDILGDEYDLGELREMVQAKQEGRCVVLPCKPSDVTVYQLRSKKHARGVGVSPRNISCATVWADGIYALHHQGQDDCLGRDLGKTWFLDEEGAEAALRREQDG